MKALTRGKYRARLATGQADVARAQDLRHAVFWTRRGLAAGQGRDADGFDALCRHVLVEDLTDGALMGCFRVMILPDGAALGQSYAGQVYDLTPLQAYPGPLIEMGRFCLHPDQHDPDILRLAWGAVTRLVDAAGARMLFGCSSFDGADPALHGAALALLRERHLGPAQYRPRPKAAQVVALPEAGLAPRGAFAAIPPLLRTYLGMGGWVSDHAVIDPALDTLHVFTAVEIDKIPAARARALRLIAQD